MEKDNIKSVQFLLFTPFSFYCPSFSSEGTEPDLIEHNRTKFLDSNSAGLKKHNATPLHWSDTLSHSHDWPNTAWCLWERVWLCLYLPDVPGWKLIICGISSEQDFYTLVTQCYTIKACACMHVLQVFIGVHGNMVPICAYWYIGLLVYFA